MSASFTGEGIDVVKSTVNELECSPSKTQPSSPLKGGHEGGGGGFKVKKQSGKESKA